MPIVDVKWSRVVVLALLSLLGACALAVSCALPDAARAEEIDDIRAEIDAELAEMDELGGEIEHAKKRVNALSRAMEKTLGEIAEKQAEHAKLQASASAMAVELYKDRDAYNLLMILDGSDTITDVIWRLDMREKVFERYRSVVDTTHKEGEELQEKYGSVSRDRDEQQKLLRDLKEKTKKLNESVKNLRKREKILSATEKAALAQAAAQAGMIAETFETGTVGDDELEWQTGITTAYGGESDKSTPNPGETATGTICDDWSVGVAVPMNKNPSEYYGRYVEISYEGQSIIAPVVDCGYMGNGYVDFDLQPGVFKAFGCATCDDWGVREVQYRYI